MDQAKKAKQAVDKKKKELEAQKSIESDSYNRKWKFHTIFTQFVIIEHSHEKSLIYPCLSNGDDWGFTANNHIYGTFINLG